MSGIPASSVLLILVASANLVAAGRRPVKPIDIPSCPVGCACRDFACSQHRTNSRISCKEVGVFCQGRNVLLKLDDMPMNTTHITITGDDMGHISMDIFAKRFSRLKKLFLPNNTIRSIRVAMKIKRLNTLILDHNNLCYLPVRNLTKYTSLRTLRVRGNNLTFISEILFPARLIDLDLKDNHIETPRKGSFRNLRKLQFLRLDNNSITEIEPFAFSYLKRLESITLDHNQISQIPARAFTSLTNVSYIGLSHNRIDSIDPTAFKQMGVKYHLLHEIRLEHNLISTLETSSISILFSRKRIYAIYLYGNPLFCDCELHQIRENTGKLLRDANRAECVTPPSLAGITLSNLNLTGCEASLEDDGDFYYDDYDFYEDDED